MHQRHRGRARVVGPRKRDSEGRQESPFCHPLMARWSLHRSFIVFNTSFSKEKGKISMVNTQNSSTTSLPVEHAAWGRLWLIGLFAILASDLVNVILATLAVSLLSVPPAPQLQLPAYSTFTAVGALGAVLVFALVNRLSRRPIQLYRIIATIVLFISFVPDLLLLSAPGTSPSDIAVLMVMHIATYLVTVGMLTTLTRAK